jgi:murein DD-endopeptidase MepM/ murein hydrolase activator NlpD
MDIIVLRKNRTKSSHLTLNRGVVLAMFGLFIVALPIASLALGYFLAGFAADPVQASEEVEQMLAAQRQELDEVITSTKNSVTALSVRLSEIQAKAIRLDALGKRLVELNNLDKGEFDFDNQPAQGGPEVTSVADDVQVEDFVQALNLLSKQLDDRASQLMIMEQIFMNESLSNETIPSGRPVESGWLSSGFGRRADPFTGKPAYHEGVDFAGKAGTGVIAAASGVVTWAGERYGYGKMVEVDHGNGYVTRYGHNEVINVEVGGVVEKGQVIALMGSSGRSTGPHVHFEVLRGGKPVDPKKYVYR